MKSTAFILSLLILLMAITPCSDQLRQADSQVETYLQASPDQHPCEKTADHCSPLCTCHCCHTPSITSDQTQFVITQKITGDIQHGIFYHPQEPVYSIWHPPNV